MLFYIIMENSKNISFMQIALDEASNSAERGEVPVGALIVHENKVLTKSGNMMVKYSNPLMHAEIIVLSESSKILSDMGLSIKHEKLDLFVTLEPCAMCAQAISLCRINNLYYGADDSKGGGIRYGSKVFDHKTCHHRPNIFYGIEKDKSQAMLKGFFKNLRSKNL